MIFYGPPGNGKTEMMKNTATWLFNDLLDKYKDSNKRPEVSIIHMNFAEYTSQWHGLEQQNIKSAFDKAIEESQKGNFVLMILDEAESLLRGRFKADWDNGVNEKTVTTFLSQIDKILQEKILIVVVTNHENELDNAILSRLPNSFYFKSPPDANIRKKIIIEMLNEYKENITYDDEHDVISEIIKATAGESGRGIKQFINNMLIQLLAKKNENEEIKLLSKNIEEFKNKFQKRLFLNRTEIMNTKQYQTTFDNIIGNKDIKKKLKLYAFCLIKNIQLKKKIINIYFHGIPRTGKTTLANAYINHITKNIKNREIALFEISTDNLALNETIKSLEACSKQLAEEGYIVILICNEVNTILNKHVNDPLRAMLLNLLDKENINIIGTGNIKIADGALERRFNSIEPQKPTAENLQNILINYAKDIKASFNDLSIQINFNKEVAYNTAPTAAGAIKAFDEKFITALYEREKIEEEIEKREESNYFTIELHYRQKIN